MRTLHVALKERSYPIFIGQSLLADPELVIPHLKGRQAVVITNDVVAPLYLNVISQALTGAGIHIEQIILPDGEVHKNWQTLNLIYDGLMAARAERSTNLIALGGGVIGDMVGFAAATYQRGVPFIQVPTTLLAQVDSSVGGKTAINHPRGKNMIGAFYQPRLVLADVDTLSTLADREFKAGLAEIIKYGLIRDLPFFEWLENNMSLLLARDPAALTEAIERSCQNKADIVAQDETEQSVRAFLNLGHTFGHAIETGIGYGDWLHGEAVAVGMLMAAELSYRMGDLLNTDVQRIRQILQSAGLPIKAPLPERLAPKQYLEFMAHDKKVEQGQLRLILLRKIGQAYITTESTSEQIIASIEACC